MNFQFIFSLFFFLLFVFFIFRFHNKKVNKYENNYQVYENKYDDYEDWAYQAYILLFRNYLCFFLFGVMFFNCLSMLEMTFVAA